MVERLAYGGVHSERLDDYRRLHQRRVWNFVRNGRIFLRRCGDAFFQRFRYARRKCRASDRQSYALRRFSRFVARPHFRYDCVRRNNGFLRVEHAAAFGLECFSRGFGDDVLGDGQLRYGAFGIARRKSEYRFFAATGKTRFIDDRRVFDFSVINFVFRKSNAAGFMGFGDRFGVDVYSSNVLHLERFQKIGRN